MSPNTAVRFCPPIPVWGSQRTFAEEFVPRLLARLPGTTLYSSLEAMAAPVTLQAAQNPLCVPGLLPRLFSLIRYHLFFGRTLRRAGSRVLFCPFHNEGLVWPGKVRQILVVHDLVPVLFPRDYRVSRLLWATVYRMAILRSHRIICDSEATRADLIKHLGVPADRISVIYCGYTPPATVRARTPKLHLLYVASAHSPHKNVALLLEAFAGSRLRLTHRLRIVGTPHPRTTAALKLRVAQTDLAGRVDFLCGISREDLELEYSSAELFVYPSLYEGFGLPVLEAMARGVPVCATNAGSIPEVAGTAAVYFDPKDPAAIREAMERLAADPVLRENLSRLGLAQVKHFSWEKYATECAAVCLQVAAESSFPVS